MTDANPKEVTVSAPGKILMAGGYLVLESPNIGLVVAADKRFFSTVKTLSAPSDVDKDDLVSFDEDQFSHKSIVDVHSPQYDTIFSYFVLYNNANDAIDNNDKTFLHIIPRSKSQSANPFIERTLLLTFGYILYSQKETSKILPDLLGIKLRADNDFYSQVPTIQKMNISGPPTPAHIESFPPFLPAGEHKTGMGSSAALVTSLVASLLAYFNNYQSSNDMDLAVVHNVAQTAHSLAQGKIGSGFDVSAAVYGSQIYSRFSQSLIQPLLLAFSSSQNDHKLSLDFAQTLHSCIHQDWDTVQKGFWLPKDMEIIMADVCGGSESPSMARKVLAWHKNYHQNKEFEKDDEGMGDMDDDDDYWEGLKNINTELYNLFTELHELLKDMEPTKQMELFQTLSMSKSDAWASSKSALSTQILNIREAFLESRSLLKAMGEAANVPIEPDEQTALADATMDLEGVVAAGVPGAGGFDALFCLYVKGKETEKSDMVRDNVAKLWGNWKGGEDVSVNNDVSVISPMCVRAVGWGEGLQLQTEMKW